MCKLLSYTICYGDGIVIAIAIDEDDLKLLAGLCGKIGEECADMIGFIEGDDDDGEARSVCWLCCGYIGSTFHDIV